MHMGVLVFLVRCGKVLLVKKPATAHIGAGLWSPVNINLNRTIKSVPTEQLLKDVQKRLASNGVEVNVNYFNYGGEVAIIDKIDQSKSWYLSLWRITNFVGEYFNSSNGELCPTWFPIGTLQFAPMLETDKLFVQKVVQGRVVPIRNWIIHKNYQVDSSNVFQPEICSHCHR